MRILDVVGAINLHGFPGLIGSILSGLFRTIYLDEKGYLQIIGAFMTFGLSLFGGLFVGAIIYKLNYFTVDDYFNDEKQIVMQMKK